MLEGKVTVVTGSAIGTGHGVSVALARQSARIAALDIDTDTAHQVEAAEQGCALKNEAPGSRLLQPPLHFHCPYDLLG